ncbi:LPS translocon maturation chaperone LptM [Rhizobium terricola]|jgi:predicted small lipoprotein YifL|nr:lipoprotein [Rhizobium terricola]
MDWVMVKTLSRATMAAGILAAALVLTGCGRKADLDPPNMPAAEQNKLAPGQKAQKPTVADDPFILDPLL